MTTSRQLASLLARLILIGFTMTLVVTCGDGGTGIPDNGDDGIPGIDTIPPAAVTGLVARAPTTSSITLVWFSTGDDGSVGKASSYDVRRFESPITESNWDSAAAVSGLPAPKPAGQVETIVVSGLHSEAEIYFALKTADEAGNVSGISNSAMSKTLDMAPFPITNLKAAAINDTDFRLTWTPTGDDGDIGTASQYDIRYATNTINDGNWGLAHQVVGEAAPRTSGEPDTFTVTGLNPNTNYYFAMKIGDEADNWSWLSNVSPAFAYGINLWVTPQTIVPVPGALMQIAFRSSPDDVTRVNIWGLTNNYPWHLVIRRHLVNATLPPDVYVEYWDLMDDEGNPTWPGWSVQCTIKLLWGTTLVDSILVRINPE